MDMLSELPGDALESNGGANEEIDKARQDFLLACLENLRSADVPAGNQHGQIPSNQENQHGRRPSCGADDPAAEREIQKPDNGDELSDGEFAMLTQMNQHGAKQSNQENQRGAIPSIQGNQHGRSPSYGIDQDEKNMSDVKLEDQGDDESGGALIIDEQSNQNGNELLYRQVVKQIVAGDISRHQQNLMKGK